MYSPQACMLETVSRRESLCIHHKRMLETVSRRERLCIHHKCMLETLSRREKTVPLVKDRAVENTARRSTCTVDELLLWLVSEG